MTSTLLTKAQHLQNRIVILKIELSLTKNAFFVFMKTMFVVISETKIKNKISGVQLFWDVLIDCTLKNPCLHHLWCSLVIELASNLAMQFNGGQACAF
jgi:hypothetical protein